MYSGLYWTPNGRYKRDREVLNKKRLEAIVKNWKDKFYPVPF